MTVSSMPPNTIVAGPTWVAIKEEFPRNPNLPWAVSGSGISSTTNKNIDEMIESHRASVLRIGDRLDAPEIQPEPGILATVPTGSLTPDSKFTVDGNTYPIPGQTRRIRPGSRMGIHRLLEALQDAGYRPVGGDYRASLVPDGIRVEPISG